MRALQKGNELTTFLLPSLRFDSPLTRNWTSSTSRYRFQDGSTRKVHHQGNGFLQDRRRDGQDLHRTWIPGGGQADVFEESGQSAPSSFSFYFSLSWVDEGYGRDSSFAGRGILGKRRRSSKQQCLKREGGEREEGKCRARRAGLPSFLRAFTSFYTQRKAS